MFSAEHAVVPRLEAPAAELPMGGRLTADRLAAGAGRLVSLSWLFSFLVCLMFFAAPVLAAEEGAKGWGIWDTLGRFFNLFLLGGTIFYFVRKPVAAFFENRRRDLQRQLAEAQKRRQEAEDRLRGIEQRMYQIEKELTAIRRKAEQETAEDARRVEESSRQESEKILSVARREIDGILKVALKDLRRYAGTLSVDLAEEMIRKSMTGADQERIFDSSVGELEKIKS